MGMRHPLSTPATRLMLKPRRVSSCAAMVASAASARGKRVLGNALRIASNSSITIGENVELATSAKSHASNWLPPLAKPKQNKEEIDTGIYGRRESVRSVTITA